MRSISGKARASVSRRTGLVNRDLAAAAASDRGWDRSTLEDAARRIYATEHGGEPVELVLVEVRDRPGTDEDEAVFRCGDKHLTLGRRAGDWVHASAR